MLLLLVALNVLPIICLTQIFSNSNKQRTFTLWGNYLYAKNSVKWRNGIVDVFLSSGTTSEDVCLTATYFSYLWLKNCFRILFGISTIVFYIFILDSYFRSAHACFMKYSMKIGKKIPPSLQFSHFHEQGWKKNKQQQQKQQKKTTNKKLTKLSITPFS